MLKSGEEWRGESWWSWPMATIQRVVATSTSSDLFRSVTKMVFYHIVDANKMVLNLSNSIGLEIELPIVDLPIMLPMINRN
jgi:hypothetical protein